MKQSLAMTETHFDIKYLIQEKNDAYRNYILNDKNPQVFDKKKYLQNGLKN